MTFKEFSDQAHAMIEAEFPGTYHSALVDETRFQGDKSKLTFKVWLGQTHEYFEAPNAEACLQALRAKLDALKGVPANTESIGVISAA